MQDYLNDSLYFSVSRLNRNIQRIADEIFKPTGLPPSYGLLLLLLDEWKELSPTKISETLDIKPSTTTRFLDKLQKQDIVVRRTNGKYSFISLTAFGLSKLPEIKGAFETLEYKLQKSVSARISNREKPVLLEMADQISKKGKK
ncbi:MarR family protein [Candidatus Izimaplasma bacterium HR1]|jgi:DNA-binding MarR family transcriptional regulator|uniref:MarR family winged helix-turn-helix transcriptional regulator n=1 Tax=Candidatus Izimoplasma sp. HR1 TaxID=1541959 RepID=UPI0004F88B6D|nr:MarR family protein [Candidatus Izimaplasma bacterium HR1]